MKHRGLTLLEMVIALAIMAVVASLALPTLGGTAERARLKSAAETLAADLAEARFESARRVQPLHVDLTPGPGWCWVVATTDACPCTGAQACRLKATTAVDFSGIELVEGHSMRVDPGGAIDYGGSAVFESPHGAQLRVDVSVLGRAHICSPQGKVPGYPAC